MEGNRYLPLIAGVFCGTLICTIILSSKIVSLYGITFPASIILFPATFVFGDILTEVYGYGVTRQVVWAGLVSELIWVGGYWISAALPPAPFRAAQEAYVEVLGTTPRIAVAGMMAYVIGEFLNSYVLARLKLLTEGRYLALRLIGSTLVGAGADTLVVLTIAFAGVFAASDLIRMGLSVWALKVAWEVLALPLTLLVIGWLKRQEGRDHFDRGTDFSPFALSAKRTPGET